MIPKRTKLPLYRAQVLRMWLDPATHYLPVWRFSLEDVETGARSGFADLDALIYHLLNQMEQLPDRIPEIEAIAQ